jgi:hypothetical protein
MYNYKIIKKSYEIGENILDGKIGVAFIISIERFDNNINEFRSSGFADRINLISTLSELNFEVNIVKTSDGDDGKYTCEEIKAWIKEKVGTHSSFQHCIFMFFLLSQGENDCTFFTSDNQRLCFRTEILEPLQNSLYLSNALKIFVLDASRIKNEIVTVQENCNIDNGISKHTVFIQSTSSNEGSFRFKDSGSQFIYYFVKVLKEHHKSVEFIQMTTFINRLMDQQSCVVSFSLKGLLFLYPNVIFILLYSYNILN